MADFDVEAADAEKKVALAELENIDADAVQKIFVWWNMHYMVAGHKRLYQALKAVATGKVKPQVE